MEDGHWDETHCCSARVTARFETPLEPDRRQRGSSTCHSDFLRAHTAALSRPVEDRAKLSKRRDSLTVDGDSAATATPATSEGGESEGATAYAEAGSGGTYKTGSPETAHLRDSEGRGAQGAKSGSARAGNAGASRSGENRYGK